MAEPVLRLDGVRKSYNVGTPVEAEVLHGVSFKIGTGEFAALIGPSGSGKSTFLRCLNKLEDITAGRVIVDGFDLTDKRVDLDRVRQHIGMVTQDTSLLHRSVRDNILYGRPDAGDAQWAIIVTELPVPPTGKPFFSSSAIIGSTFFWSATMNSMLLRIVKRTWPSA